MTSETQGAPASATPDTTAIPGAEGTAATAVASAPVAASPAASTAETDAAASGAGGAGGGGASAATSADATSATTPSAAPDSAAPQSAPAAQAADVPADTSALNRQVVQAVTFTNQQTGAYGQQMTVLSPEAMVGQTTGQAVQNAEAYMNAVMQIALAAQAVALKKAAEGPVEAVKEVPLLAEIQKMVAAAVSVYGSVSTTAGTSAKTVYADLETG